MSRLPKNIIINGVAYVFFVLFVMAYFMIRNLAVNHEYSQFLYTSMGYAGFILAGLILLSKTRILSRFVFIREEITYISSAFSLSVGVVYWIFELTDILSRINSMFKTSGFIILYSVQIAVFLLISVIFAFITKFLIKILFGSISSIAQIKSWLIISVLLISMLGISIRVSGLWFKWITDLFQFKATFLPPVGLAVSIYIVVTITLYFVLYDDHDYFQTAPTPQTILPPQPNAEVKTAPTNNENNIQTTI